MVTGESLLHYRLAEKIGEGGMGAVWRATDSTLGRDVAIKVLPAEFASDPERLARFEREAKVLASLNHPNIAAIYGFHEANGVRFLAMELVPGEDLAERLKKGSVPFSEAMEIAGQIAEALEAAHDQGVIHRDLKPANVRLTPEGKVKVLDFGLAKALETATTSSPGRDPAMSPTITSLGTVAGVILGTAAYMSPEQARGKPVDKRADIWGFGCLVFEMLSGARPFEGETISDTLAAVLAKDPDWTKLPATIPARVREILQRCLEKDVKRRLRDVHDLRIELAETGGQGGLSRSPGLSPSVPSRTPMLLITTAVAVISLAVAAWALTRSAPPAAASRLTRLSIARPENPGSTGPGTFALAPDGSAVVFSLAKETGEGYLWIRDLDDPVGRVIQGTDNAFYPFWSPDSKQIAFFADGKLKRVPRAGGAVQRVCDAANGRGGAWSQSGMIVFAPNPYSPLFKVSADGGVPEAATKLDATGGTNSHRFPCFLPDGRHFTYGVLPEIQPNLYPVALASLDEPVGKRLLDSRAAPRYAAPGYLIFARDQAVVAQRIDLETLTMVGEVIPLVDRPSVVGSVTGAPIVDCAGNGTIVYDGIDRRPTDVVSVSRDGRPIKTILRHPAAAGGSVLSNRGDRLAMLDFSEEGSALWIADLSAGTAGRVTRPDQTVFGISWMPDDTRVVSNVTDGRNRVLMSIDSRSGAQRVVRKMDGWEVPTSIAPDGTVLLDKLISGSLNDIVYVPRGEGTDTPAYLATPANEGNAAISPDGRVVAYTSDASGRQELYLDTFPGHGEARRVSTEGGTGATWRADGRELYFGSGRTLLACDVKTSPSIEVGKPHALFALPKGDVRGAASGPNGDVFYFLLPVGENPSNLTVVQNWAAQLGKQGD
jgi:serine/threonine protein kinase/Tol biopolymer transport system component